MTEKSLVRAETRALGVVCKEVEDNARYLESILPSDTPYASFYAALNLHMMNVPNIDRADPVSVLEAVRKMASHGHIPGEDAFIGTFYNNKEKAYKAQYLSHYQGLAKSLFRTGLVNNAIAVPVYENDHYVVDLLQNIFEHRPARKKRGDIESFYSAVWMKGQDKPLVWPMGLEDVERARRRSRGAESGAWQTDYVEMGRKTTFKNHCKYLRIASREFQEVLEAEEESLSSSPPSLAQANAASRDLFDSDIQGLIEEPEVDHADPPDYRPAPAIAKAASPGPTDRQANAIYQICKRKKWAQRDIEKYLDTLHTPQDASEAIELLNAGIDPRTGEVAEHENPRDEFRSWAELEPGLERIGRWKDWRPAVEKFLSDRAWRGDNLTTTQHHAVAAFVAGLEHPDWNELFGPDDGPWKNVIMWGRGVHLSAWDTACWMTGNPAMPPDMRTKKPIELPQEQVTHYEGLIKSEGDNLILKITDYGNKMRVF